MAKTKRSLEDLEQEDIQARMEAEDSNGQGQSQSQSSLSSQPVPGSSLEERVAEHDHKIDNADRQVIDDIILHNDVQKGGKIRIERKAPLGRDYQWVTTMPAESWTNTDEVYEYFKTTYGGGDYRCMASRADGRKYKGFSFTIDYRYKGSMDQNLPVGDSKGSNEIVLKMLEMQRQQSNIQQPAPGLQTSDMIKMMEMGSSRSEQMMTLVMTMMMKSQETMSTVLAAVISARSNSGPVTTIDPVIVELLKSKQDRPPMMEVLEMMKAIKDLNSDSEPAKDETMFDKVLKAASLVIPALSSGGPAAPQLTAGVASPSHIPGQIPGQAPGHPQGMVAQLPLTMRIGIAGLVKAAERGSDPELYADLVMDQISTEQHKQLLTTILTDPQWLAKLFGDETRVAHVKPWLEQLRTSLLSYDTNSDASPDQPAPGGESPPE